MKLPFRLIDGWQRAWRLLTVHAACALLLLVQFQDQAMPALRTIWPALDWSTISAVFALAIVVLRVIDQPHALVPKARQAEQVEKDSGEKSGVKGTL